VSDDDEDFYVYLMSWMTVVVVNVRMWISAHCNFLLALIKTVRPPSYIFCS